MYHVLCTGITYHALCTDIIMRSGQVLCTMQSAQVLCTMHSAKVVCTMCSAKVLCTKCSAQVLCTMCSTQVSCTMLCISIMYYVLCTGIVYHVFCTGIVYHELCTCIIMLCTGIMYHALHRYYVPCALHRYHVPCALLRYTCRTSCSSVVLVSTPVDHLFACLHFLSLTRRRLSVVSEDKQSLLTQWVWLGCRNIGTCADPLFFTWLLSLFHSLSLSPVHTHLLGRFLTKPKLAKFTSVFCWEFLKNVWSTYYMCVLEES